VVNFSFPQRNYYLISGMVWDEGVEGVAEVAEGGGGFFLEVSFIIRHQLTLKRKLKVHFQY
jgi:hypothetical protein